MITESFHSLFYLCILLVYWRFYKVKLLGVVYGFHSIKEYNSFCSRVNLKIYFKISWKEPFVFSVFLKEVGLSKNFLGGSFSCVVFCYILVVFELFSIV